MRMAGAVVSMNCTKPTNGLIRSAQPDIERLVADRNQRMVQIGNTLGVLDPDHHRFVAGTFWGECEGRRIRPLDSPAVPEPLDSAEGRAFAVAYGQCNRLPCGDPSGRCLDHRCRDRRNLVMEAGSGLVDDLSPLVGRGVAEAVAVFLRQMERLRTAVRVIVAIVLKLAFYASLSSTPAVLELPTISADRRTLFVDKRRRTTSPDWETGTFSAWVLLQTTLVSDKSVQSSPNFP